MVPKFLEEPKVRSGILQLDSQNEMLFALVPIGGRGIGQLQSVEDYLAGIGSLSVLCSRCLFSLAAVAAAVRECTVLVWRSRRGRERTGCS
jgi:hypothetical protein